MLLSKARVREGFRVYAIGDIHGCIDQLLALLACIEQDVLENRVADHKIIFLGDYVDRGPASSGVLDHLFGLSKQSHQTVFLRGNHDERFASFMKEPSLVADGFLQWGGIQTIESYGVEIKAGVDIGFIHRELKERVPDKHCDFLARLEMMHVESDYVFVHAGVRPGRSLDYQHQQDLLWIRNDFLNHAEPFEKVVVHGHTPVNAPEFQTNRINVDTGCVYGGRLTAVVLEGQIQRVLQV